MCVFFNTHTHALLRYPRDLRAGPRAARAAPPPTAPQSPSRRSSPRRPSSRPGSWSRRRNSPHPAACGTWTWSRC